MNKISLSLYCLLGFSSLWAQKPILPNDQSEWWKRNNLRLIQMNLPAYEAAKLDADSIVKDLRTFSANTLIINAGGIMAFYESKLDFHYLNPYMKPGDLGRIVQGCHEQGIRVIVRFDFSRADQSIFQKHPDWFYLSPTGKRIVNTDKYVVSINAPYVQEKAFDIIAEVLDNFDVDGIFLNMPGYQTRNSYENTYEGIDQNEYDKAAFKKWSGGLELPLKEDKNDPVFRKYEEFKKESISLWSKKLHELVKGRKKKVAICTYLEDYVDIIRHESQTHGLPYWPYTGSDNTNHIEQTFPDKIVSNASIQQISFRSRFNAAEPEEVGIRLWENLANGSGTDVSLMGDLREYEDQRNFAVMKKIYAFQKKWEPYFGKYESVAKVAVVAPGYWPGGLPMEEYRGIQLMLKEAHIPFDIIQDNHLARLKAKLGQYKVLILPDIQYLAAQDLAALQELSQAGVSLFASNRSLFDAPAVLKTLFGATIVKDLNDGEGNYLQPNDPKIFTHFVGQSMVHFKYNLGLYQFDQGDKPLLPILDKGRPGPPEMIGGHDPLNYFAANLHQNGKSTNALMPINIGRIYYQTGYEQHKYLVLDVLKQLYPAVDQQIITNAHPRVEMILNEYMPNTAEVTIATPFRSAGHVLHLINLTGFSGNTYFEPLPIYDTEVKIKVDYRPRKVWRLGEEKPITFVYQQGYVSFKVGRLADYAGIVVEK
ncbi:MAG: alpha-amylase family protein [Haliscomenobacter sp.]|uniref:alpha-amylase family protein n=1 Tax=Haliscomenobacter sp. TaxID=2717303 RepID=UPI0029AC619C|nr:alpha-amylase family protein [Haliscomenobacter sp.]MDX2068562.1 alpha-amylase family protein [Haliscomenobacter sp.]